MGITTITTLAGAPAPGMTGTSLVTAARELVTGITVVFRSFGTWLIPAFVTAGWWHHVIHRVPVRQAPPWWGIVFPLGMYGAATHALGTTRLAPVLTALGENEIRLALAAWTVVFVAMLLRSFRATRHD
ncbi:tellurite resistance protein TehA-like permease [Saccharopolyspora lacisalsi]|uniref:Tellurite resistance protein TehA-like permease n=1 Tax=Halosaccharopolyspora lacisalsi TaxID=1000566 RepID=A0A839E3I7_9PSEU|nr:hypothetical protein [Halosaccharopolyspora lacisalsi]MBA8825488.1 tellurite resistance protein TehA-like permease [Halosaccharopolyspora lacisalsi]